MNLPDGELIISLGRLNRFLLLNFTGERPGSFWSCAKQTIPRSHNPRCCYLGKLGMLIKNRGFGFLIISNQRAYSWIDNVFCANCVTHHANLFVMNNCLYHSRNSPIFYLTSFSIKTFQSIVNSFDSYPASISQPLQ